MNACAVQTAPPQPPRPPTRSTQLLRATLADKTFEKADRADGSTTFVSHSLRHHGRLDEWLIGGGPPEWRTHASQGRVTHIVNLESNQSDHIPLGLCMNPSLVCFCDDTADKSAAPTGGDAVRVDSPMSPLDKIKYREMMASLGSRTVHNNDGALSHVEIEKLVKQMYEAGIATCKTTPIRPNGPVIRPTTFTWTSPLSRARRRPVSRLAPQGPGVPTPRRRRGRKRPTTRRF
jgi:hypothetical protein